MINIFITLRLKTNKKKEKEKHIIRKKKIEKVRTVKYIKIYIFWNSSKLSIIRNLIGKNEYIKSTA